MKKILSLGAAAAVLSMTAVAASAAIYPAVLEDAAVAGEQITVEILASDLDPAASQFVVVASEALELDTYATDYQYSMFNEATGKFVFADTTAITGESVILTLTYNVVGEADDEVSVALVPDAGFEAGVDTEAIELIVIADETEVPDVTVETEIVDTFETEIVDTFETEIVDTADTADTGIVIDTVDTADTADTADTTDPTTPDTGIALAVVPAVLAGAAIIVAKKRS